MAESVGQLLARMGLGVNVTSDADEALQALIESSGPQGPPGSGASITEYSVDSTASAGATTITLDRTATAPVTIGAVVLLSAHTVRAELKTITGVSGADITVSATRSAHNIGDPVVVLVNHEVSALQYGLIGDGTDESGAVQRLLYEATLVGVTIVGKSGQDTANYAVQKPVIVQTGSRMRAFSLRTRTGYTPIDAAGALLMVASRVWLATADAGTDTFTVSGGHGMGGPGSYSEVNNTKIAFKAMYGETLPSPLVEGKVYYIKSTPTTSTFTISDTPGGSTFNITANGTGAWGFEAIEELSRVYWQDLRVDLSVADVSGIRLSMQQPAYIRGLRIEMDIACTVRTYGIALRGQICYLRDVEINPHQNCTGLYIFGGATGVSVQGFNCNGVAVNGDIGIEVNDGNNIYLSDVWTEFLNGAGILLTAGRNIVIDGPWIAAGNANTVPALKIAANTVSYKVGSIYIGTNGRLLEDTAKGYTLFSSLYSGADASIASDYHGTFPGWTSMATNFGSTQPYTPVFTQRFNVPVAASPYNVRYIDGTIFVNSTGGARTLSLPAAANWAGHEWVIVHSSGSNTLTVDTAGSETIDGSASITIPAGELRRIMSDGTNFHIV